MVFQRSQFPLLFELLRKCPQGTVDEFASAGAEEAPTPGQFVCIDCCRESHTIRFMPQMIERGPTTTPA